MQEEQRPPPPAYAQHEPESLHLPSVPTHALPSTAQNNDRLPGIRSLDLPDASPARTNGHSLRHEMDLSPKSSGDAMQWGVLPPLNSATFPRVPEGLPRGSVEVDIGSPMDTASIASAQEDAVRRRETSVLSMDDPDVRLAAEALSGLGNPDFARSPTARSVTIPRDSAAAEPEPLLSLITSNHPWLGGTIHGSISAYNTTKTYSPRFVKYGAELIERNIGSPMVNTVSSVGRRTGVEKNLRRYLGEVHRRPSDLEAGDTDAARKRQRVRSPGPDAMDTEDPFSLPSRTRNGSQSSYAETLPAYDDQRSPKYEETAVTVHDVSSKDDTTTQDRRPNWSTQLIMTTSGLGVALSETSLRSLRTCLRLLRTATSHIDAVMHALRLVIEEYNSAIYPDEKAGPSSAEGDKEERVRAIASRMKSLSSDIWTTLQGVVQAVSRHTGGALPQNARLVVRTQLLSVPQRWQSASRSATSNESEVERSGGEEVRGANRMLAFAKEGLDMMGQITAVVDGTVGSAEAWLGRMGRAGEAETGAGAENAPKKNDEKMEVEDEPLQRREEKMDVEHGGAVVVKREEKV